MYKLYCYIIFFYTVSINYLDNNLAVSFSLPCTYQIKYSNQIKIILIHINNKLNQSINVCYCWNRNKFSWINLWIQFSTNWKPTSNIIYRSKILDKILDKKWNNNSSTSKLNKFIWFYHRLLKDCNQYNIAWKQYLFHIYNYKKVYKIFQTLKCMIHIIKKRRNNYFKLWNCCIMHIKF